MPLICRATIIIKGMDKAQLQLLITYLVGNDYTNLTKRVEEIKRATRGV